MKDTKRYRLGRGKSWTGQTEDSILMTELKQRNGKVTPNRFRRLYEMASQQNRVRDRASHSRKQQTARSHRPVRMGLHCQARFDHYPRRQCNLYGLNLQLDKWSLKQSPLLPLDCLMASDQTCHHPHRFNGKRKKERKKDPPPPPKKKKKKNVEWEAQTGLSSKTCGFTALDMLE